MSLLFYLSYLSLFLALGAICFSFSLSSRSTGSSVTHRIRIMAAKILIKKFKNGLTSHYIEKISLSFSLGTD